MSCIAMSVGLGNIWRFPFTAYQNGGGAFLIPYVIILILVGRPLYYLEMCIGQFTSKGNVKSLEAVATVLKGIAVNNNCIKLNCRECKYVCITTCMSRIVWQKIILNKFTILLPYHTYRTYYLPYYL